MVVLDNLAIGYQTKRGVKVVAHGLNAALHKGQLTCLLGPNGVGKSTLLRTLSAFQPPLDGRILLAGKPLATYDSAQLSTMIGIVLTEKPDLRNMTVSELVAMGRAPYTDFWGTLTKSDRHVVTDSLAVVGIGQLASRTVDTLSDGELQKAMIAKALAQQTPLIFLDEPTAFLDFPSKAAMMQLLRRLARTMQKTIFMSTHDLEMALQVADTVWLMEHGQLSIGTPRQLADSGQLSTFIDRPGITFDPQALRVTVACE